MSFDLRANATIIATIAAGIAAVAVITIFDPPGTIGTSAAFPLCINGHPTRRPPNPTYGGLAPRHGFVRDHRCPLGLGCPDTALNVFYQSCDRFELEHGHYVCVEGEAAKKDDVEWQTIQDMCAGRITAQAARQLPYFQPGYWASDGGTHR